jgi:hypothetical protein
VSSRIWGGNDHTKPDRRPLALIRVKCLCCFISHRGATWAVAVSSRMRSRARSTPAARSAAAAACRVFVGGALDVFSHLVIVHAVPVALPPPRPWTPSAAHLAILNSGSRKQCKQQASLRLREFRIIHRLRRRRAHLLLHSIGAAHRQRCPLVHGLGGLVDLQGGAAGRSAPADEPAQTGRLSGPENREGTRAARGGMPA